MSCHVSPDRQRANRSGYLGLIGADVCKSDTINTIGVIRRDTFEGIKELSSLQNASIRPLARHTQEEKKVLGLGAAIIHRCSLLNRRSLKVSFITL